MGLSIHYQGKFKNASQLPSMIAEVVEIAKANHWKYFIFENKFPNATFTKKPDKNDLYGISVFPPECEMVSFSFLSNGKMCGAEKLQINKYSEDLEEDENLYYLHTKTQYAGIDVHKKIILLFDHLNTFYFKDFELSDEGQYWETRNEELLKTTFDRYTNLIESLKSNLEEIPLSEGENTEDYLQRIIENIQKTNPEKEAKPKDEELPKLDIHDENAFKKLKLSIEYGASFFNNSDTNLPAEIESQFLDYVTNFEKAYQNPKQISVFEKLGNPKFIPATTLNDTEISIELERIQLLMQDYGLNLDVLAEYDNQERLIYTFITEELFEHIIDDMDLPGMNTCFIYEEFHPNHEYDLKRNTEDFLRIFFNKKNDFYKKSHSSEATNHIALNNFRSLFKKFKMTFFEFTEITFDEENANVKFNIDFWAKIKGTEAKITYSGFGNITFKQDYGYWYVREMNLPIMN
jgi:hypothetical protein